METSIKNNTSSYILIGVGINLISSPKNLEIILQHQFLIINLKLILLMFFLKYQEN